MNRSVYSLLTTTVAIALVQLPVHAAEGIRIDRDELDRAVAITSILENNARLAGGREIGEVEDVLFDNERQVQDVLLAMDKSNEYNRGATAFPDDVADYEEPPLYESGSAASSLELDFVLLPAEGMHYSKRNQAVEFDLDIDGISALPRSDGPNMNSPEPYASVLIGMEVDLADQESFGSVEDILLSADNGDVVAYVVDSWDGLVKHRHALPAASAEFVRAEKENAIRENYGVVAVRFPYPAAQVKALEPFDLDALKEQD